jgi:cell division protein FtsA
LTYGSVAPEKGNAGQMIEVMSMNDRPGRKIPTKMLSEVVSARYEELFQLVSAELQRSGYKDLLAAGIVLTGGGSGVNGAIELAELCFQMPVRHGSAQNLIGLTSDIVSDPSFATVVGLLLHGFQQQNDGYSIRSAGSKADGVWTKMRKWFNVNF